MFLLRVSAVIMWTKFLFMLTCVLVLITENEAAILARLCERMTPCDLRRFIRTHMKGITSVNEKTMRVDFLTNELQIASIYLSQRLDFLESRYINLTEQVSPLFRPYLSYYNYIFNISYLNDSFVDLNDIVESELLGKNDTFLTYFHETKVEEFNGDYKQSITQLTDSHTRLHDRFIAVRGDLEELKENVERSLKGTLVQRYELQRIREEINYVEDVLRSLQTVLEHHFEELRLIRPVQYPTVDIPTDSELDDLEERYSQLQSTVDDLAGRVKDKVDARGAVSEETSDNMRYTRDEFEALKFSMTAVTKTLNETHYNCINKGLEIRSKIQHLHNRINTLSLRRRNVQD